MKNKSLYYIEVTCIKDVSYPNVDLHIGDVLYFNSKASSNEMYLLYSYKHNRHRTKEEEQHVINTFGRYTSYLPFTRKKTNAKKWQIKSYADGEAKWLNNTGEFNAIVKEIKVTYQEEEV